MEGWYTVFFALAFLISTAVNLGLCHHAFRRNNSGQRKTEVVTDESKLCFHKPMGVRRGYIWECWESWSVSPGDSFPSFLKLHDNLWRLLQWLEKGKQHIHLQESQGLGEHKKKYGAGTCRRYIQKVTRNNHYWSSYA